MDIKQLLNVFFSGQNAVLKQGFASIVKAIKDIKGTDTTPIAKAINTQTVRMDKMIMKQNASLEKLANPIFEVKVDRQPIEVKPTDMSNVEAALKLIYGVLAKNESGKDEVMGEWFNTMGKSLKELKPKETVRIDDKQMTAIMAALTSNDPAPNGGLYAGRKVVTTAGTAVALAATSTRCENITITAESDNTGYIAVGDANVVAAEGSQQGVILSPLGSITVKVGDLAKIYIDSTVNGEGVTFAYER